MTTPTRIELPIGYYAQLDLDGLYTIRKPDGEAFYGGVDEAAIRTATAFAQAMRPDELVAALKQVRAVAAKYASSLKSGDVESDFASIRNEVDAALAKYERKV